MFSNRKRTSILISFLLIFGILFGAKAPATANVPTLNANVAEFKLTFGSVTAAPSQLFLVSPVCIQAAWTKLNDPITDADWITVTSNSNPFFLVEIPISGSGPSGTVAAKTFLTSDTVLLTLRGNPSCAGTPDLAGFVGRQPSSQAGQKTFSTLGAHSFTNSNARELISFGQFPGFKYLTDAFSQVHPNNFKITAQLPSTVTDLSYTFGAGSVGTGYNEIGITAWNVSNVTSFTGTFANNSSFNQNIGSWDTSSATTMDSMFLSATSFNQNIGAWNTQNVTTMNSMFKNANSFNQPLNAWNVTRVTNMTSMFESAVLFNQGLNSWSTNSLTSMSGMFWQATAFNGAIGNWNTSQVTSFANLFRSATKFNQDISSWNTASVTNMSSAFQGATVFNQNIGSWNTSNVTDMSSLFYDALAFNQNIGSWNTSNVTSFLYLFFNARAFNQDIGSWNTAKVINMSSMFQNAIAFNQNIGAWNTGQATTMSSMFMGATAFNQDIGSWNTANVTNMSSMFRTTSNFNRDIGSWNVTKVTNMTSMFDNALAFNQNISAWNTQNVTMMSFMFRGANSFNQPLNGWNVTKVTDLASMFQGAVSFNQSLNQWAPIRATSMASMFSGATSFNNGLASGVSGNMTWTMSNSVSSMSSMFSGASAFNQSISTWNSSSVGQPWSMFQGANSFNQSLANFDISGITSVSNAFVHQIFFPSGMSSANVQSTIKSWANTNGQTGFGIVFAGQNYYSDCASYSAYQRLTQYVQVFSGVAPAVPTGCTTTTLAWSPSTTNTSPSLLNGMYSFDPSTSPTGSSSFRFYSRTGGCSANVVTGRVTYGSSGSTCTIRAIDDDPNGSQNFVDVTFTLTRYSVPSNPTLSGWTLGADSITFNWLAPSNTGGSPLTGYVIQSNLTSTTYSVAANQLSATITGLTPGVRSTYSIYAENIAGRSIASTTASAIAPDTAPLAPTINSITPGFRQLQLNFTPPTSNGGSTVQKYQYSTNGGTSWKDAVGVSSPLTITIESTSSSALANGTTYSVRLQAVNTMTGAVSNAVSGTPVDPPAAAPTDIAITPGDRQLSVAFTAAVTTGSSITNYQYSTDGGSTWRTRASGTTASPLVITTTSASNTTLVNGTSYNVQLRAVTGVTGTASASTSAAPDIAPNAPTINSITPGNRQLSVSFSSGTNSGSAITKYQYSTDGGATWRDRATGTTGSPLLITTTSSNNTQLTHESSYDVQIRAFNTRSGAASLTTSASPVGTPGEPTNVTALATGSSASISWTAGGGADAVSYTATSSPSGFNCTVSAPTTSCTINSLTLGTSYTWTVVATNNVGSSNSSVASNAVVPDIAPGAPTINSVTAGNVQLSVSFTEGTNSGSSITKYQYSTDGTNWVDASGTSSPLTLTTQSTAGTPSLVNGTSYNVRIRAFNTTAGTASTSVSSTPDATPGAPTITSITPSDRQLSVAFTAGSNSGSNITKYQYSTDNGLNWADATGTTSPLVIVSNSTSARGPLNNGDSYYVKIRAVNTITGTASNTVIEQPDIPIGAPTIVSIDPADRSFTLYFLPGTNNGGSGLSRYEYSTDGGVTWAMNVDLTSPMTLVLTSDRQTYLVNGTSYDIKLRAVNTMSGLESSLVRNNVPNIPPGAPTINSVTSGNAQLTVAFSDGTNSGTAITKYQYSTDGTTWRDLSGTTSPFTITTISGAAASSLVNGTNYNIRLRAFNTLPGLSSSASSGIPDVAPGAPTIDSITKGDGELSVVFSAGSNSGSAITKYQYSTDGGSTWRDRSTGTTASPLIITTTSDSNTSLANGTSYNVQLRAFNTVAGTASSTLAGTPEVAPGAPTITSISLGNSKRLEVNFTAGSNSGSTITKYQYSTDGGATWRDRAAGTTASPLVIEKNSSDNSDIVNGTTYNVQIRAFNTIAGTATSSVQGTPDIRPGAMFINSISVSNQRLSVSYLNGTNGGSSITKHQYSTDGGITWRDRETPGVTPFVITKTSDTNTTLVNGVTYSVQIRAFNTRAGIATTTTTATPDVAPGSPSIDSVTSGDSQLQVAFTLGSNVSGSSVTKIQYSTNGVDYRDAVGVLSPITITTTSDSSATTLVNGTTYSVTLRSVNTLTSTASSAMNGTPDIAPAAPTITSVTSGDGQLSVAFSAGSNSGSSITKYEYSTNGTIWKDATGTTSPIVISSVSTGSSTLTNGTNYNIRLRAFNTQSGASSSPVSGVPDATPGAPTITAITTSDSQLSVAFTPGTNSGSTITKYQYSTDGGSTWRDRSTGTTSSPLVIATTSSSNSSLVNGTSYSIKIRAFNTLSGTASSGVSATPDITPGAVTNLSGSSADGQVPLSWTAPTGSTITDYLIEYSSNGTTYVTFSDSVSTSTSITVTGLTNGTAYTFRVSAINGTSVGDSTTSTSITPRANQATLNWGNFSTSVAYQSTLTLSTTGGSGNGSVVYTVSQSSTCAIASNILTPGNAGSTCVITATKLSDGAYNPISTTALTITVTRISQANNISFTNSASVTYGNTLTVKAVGGSGNGDFVYSISSAGTTGCSIDASTGVLSVSAAGTCRVAAQRAASTNFLASNSVTQDISVTKAAQTITFTSTIPLNPVAGDTYQLSGSSSAGLSVSFAVTSGLCSLSGATVSFNGSGSCVIKGSQSGSSQYLAAGDVFQTIAVGQRNQVLNYSSNTLSVTSVEFGSPAFVVEASSTEPTATIVFSQGSATTNSACSISNAGLISINAVGICQIQADSASTSAYATASPIVHSFSVVPAPASAPFITSISGGNKAITLNFTPPSYSGGSQISGYQIAAISQSDSSQIIYESGCSTTTVNGEATCTVRGLSNGVSYKAKVAAITSAGVGVYSDLSSALLIATNPSAVQSLRVTQSNAQLVINWNDPDSLGGGTFSEYRIFIKLSSDTSYNQTDYFTVTDNTVYQFTANKISPTGVNLLNGTAYDIKIVTVTTANSAELTANTAVVNQIPRTVPDAPVFDDVLIIGSEVVLTWQAPANDGGSPVISYEGILDSQTCNFNSATDTYCTVPVPTVGGTFDYQVKAVNAAGRSEPATGRIQIGTAPSSNSVSNIGSSNNSPMAVIAVYKTKKAVSDQSQTSPSPSPSFIDEAQGKPLVEKTEDELPRVNGYFSVTSVLLMTSISLFIFVIWRRRKKEPRSPYELVPAID